MSKGLEAFARIKKQLKVCGENSKDLDTIETELKTLTIIKKVIKYDIEVNGNNDFDIKYEPNEVLTKEEFDLLFNQITKSKGD